MAGVQCPECSAEVQADWDWCHACGFDPDGVRAASTATASSGVAVGAPGAPAPAVPSLPPPAPGMPPPPVGPGGGPAWQPPGGSRAPSSRGPLTIVIVVVALVLLVPVLAILAITFLGRSSTSRFSSVGTAIGADGGFGVGNGGGAQPLDWQKTLGPGYSFELPGAPTTEAISSHPASGPSVDGSGYRVALPTQTYTIGSYPTEDPSTRIADPGPMIDEELKGLTQATGATITEISSAPMSGFPARNASVTVGSSTGHCFTIYTLEKIIEGCAVGDPMGSGDTHTFFSSIQIG